MKMKDMVVGEDYAYEPWPGKKIRVTIDAIGESRVPHQKFKGVTVSYAEGGQQGATKVVASRFIVRPWAEWAEIKAQKDARIKMATELHNFAMAQAPEVERALTDRGLLDLKVSVRHNGLWIRLGTTEAIIRLREIVERSPVSKTDLFTDILPRWKYLGYAIHRSLRRQMDSQASSVLWNAIEACPYRTWETILTLLNTAEGDSLRERFESLQYTTGGFGSSWKGSSIGMDASARLVRLGFEMLSDQEWEILEEACLLEYEPEEGVKTE